MKLIILFFLLGFMNLSAQNPLPGPGVRRATTDTGIGLLLTNIPPAIVQGPGLCVPTSASYVASWQRAMKDGWWYFEHDSIENLAYQMNPMFANNLVDFGMPLEFISDQGIVNMVEMPYDRFDDSTRPSLSLRYRALANRGGPVSITYSADEARSWVEAGYPLTGVAHLPAGNGHSVMVVGFDDNYVFEDGRVGAWRVLNTGGPGGADNGYSWFPVTGPYRIYQFAKMEMAYEVEPEYVIRMISNIWFKDVPDSLSLTFSYLRGGDTLRTYRYRTPRIKDYLFPVDTLSQISGADELVIKASYLTWECNKSNQPAQMSIDSLQVLSPDGSLSHLEFRQTRLDTVLDSLSTSPYLSYKLFSSCLIAKAALSPAGIDGESPRTDGLRIFPNPVGTVAHLYLWQEKSVSSELRIYDMNGRLRERFPVNLKAGENTIQWTNDLPSGIYIVKLLDGAATKMAVR